MKNLLQADGEGLFKPEAVPLVIDGKNLALDGLALQIPIFPEKDTVYSPHKVHWIFRFYESLISFAVRNPFSIYHHFCPGDIKNESFISRFI